MSVKIRNLIVGEELPEPLRTGFEATTMPEWIWVCERDGKIVGSLVTAPAHIVVIFLRFSMTEEAHPFDARALLLGVVKEAKDRGYKGYMSYFDPEKESEKAFMDIVSAAGGFQFKSPQIACFGRL